MEVKVTHVEAGSGVSLQVETDEGEVIKLSVYTSMTQPPEITLSQDGRVLHDSTVSQKS